MNEIEVDDADSSVQLYMLGQEFLKAHRSNSNVTVSQFAAQHPKLADAILDTFPGLLLAEDLRRINGITEPPEKLGPYSLVRCIGKGGMGTVYEARHSALSRPIAIKLLNDDLQQSTRDRFLKEAELASRLHHPNVVPLIDFAVENDVPYIAMLYINGCSLDRLIREHLSDCQQTTPNERADYSVVPGRDFQKIARTGSQAASAIACSHDMGMIHRDIKPGNLILDGNGKTWVTDFGLATESRTSSSENAAFAGTLRYMAPEQFEGNADERTDIYSLGLTLYELATGTQVFGDIEPEEMARAKTKPIETVINLNPRIPKAFADIIMRACCVDPSNRYPTAKELEVVLNRFAHSGIAGDRRARARKTDSSKRRLRPLTLLGGGVLLSIAAISFAATRSEVPTGGEKQVSWFISTDTATQPTSSSKPRLNRGHLQR